MTEPDVVDILAEIRRPGASVVRKHPIGYQLRERAEPAEAASSVPECRWKPRSQRTRKSSRATSGPE